MHAILGRYATNALKFPFPPLSPPLPLPSIRSNPRAILVERISLLRLFLLRLACQDVALLHRALLSPLARGLVLVALGLHFFLEDTLALFLGFGFVDLWEWKCVRLMDHPWREKGKGNVVCSAARREGELGLAGQTVRIRTCSTSARLCLNVLPLLR